MLVLSRKKNEQIIIPTSDGPILIQWVETRSDGHKVRLGITAPKTIPVHRIEVFEAIHGSEILKDVLAKAG